MLQLQNTTVFCWRRSVCLPVCLSVCLFVCLSVRLLSAVCLSAHVFICHAHLVAKRGPVSPLDWRWASATCLFLSHCSTGKCCDGWQRCIVYVSRDAAVNHGSRVEHVTQRAQAEQEDRDDAEERQARTSQRHKTPPSRSVPTSTPRILKFRPLSDLNWSGS